MNKTINQHYVPRCLLQHFGWKAGKYTKINIFDLVKSEVRYNQAIKEVFSKNYFYDKDNSVENLLSNDIESPVSRVINEIVQENFSIIETDDNRLKLIRFISSLLGRTPKSRERMTTFINTQIESIVRQLLEFNGFDPDEAKNGSFQFEDPSDLVFLTTLYGIIYSEILKDLSFKIIKNETELDFYIGDHPVFTYNWFYKDLQHPSITSINARGLQIFVPLSPKHTLCLYDSEVYKYGQNNNVITLIPTLDDVEILNSFQVINSSSLIGFNHRKSEKNLKLLRNKNKGKEIYQFKNDILTIEENAQGKIRSLHLCFIQQAKLSKIPSFIKVKKKARIYSKIFSERNPNLASALAQII